MNNNKKAFLYSPLIGAIFSTILYWGYGIYLIVQEINKVSEPFSIEKLIISALTLLPVFLIISLFISYLFFYPMIFITNLIKKTYGLKEGAGWAIMFFSAFVIATTVAIIDYYNYHMVAKSIIIVISFSFSMLFNSSLFSVITQKAK